MLHQEKEKERKNFTLERVKKNKILNNTLNF